MSKKDAYYFPHFSNARNDSKILKLRRVLGIEGYGIFFMLLEILREQSDFKYNLENIPDLEYEWHVSKEKILAVITNFDLFTITEDKFFSSKLVLYLQPYLEKTERARIAANTRWSKVSEELNKTDANAMQMQCLSNAPAMQGKERKEKENKEKKNKEKEESELSNTQKKDSILDRKLEFKNKVINAINSSDEITRFYFTKDSYKNAKDFFEYWSESSENAKKFRAEMEKTFDIGRRLSTWLNRDNSQQNGNKSSNTKNKGCTDLELAEIFRKHIPDVIT